MWYYKSKENYPPKMADFFINMSLNNAGIKGLANSIWGKQISDDEANRIMAATQGGDENLVREYLQNDIGFITDQQKAATSNLLAEQDAKTQDFLGRYTSGIEEARNAISGELNLPGLRETTQTAGQTARDVSRQVQDIPEMQKTIAKQVGISAPRLQQRTAAETAKLQPAAESAQRALQDAVANQQFGETQYTERLQEFTQPYQLEASFLSESLAREFSGYTQQMQNELELTMQKISNQQAVTIAEINKATQLAVAEADYMRQKDLLQLQGQQSIDLEQQLKNLGLGSYYQKPTTVGSSYSSGW